MPFPSPLAARRARPSPLRAADTTAPQQRRRVVTAVAVTACALVGAVIFAATLRPATAPAPAPPVTAAAPPGPAAVAVTAPPGTRVQTVVAAAPRGLRAGDVVDVIAAFDPDLVPGSEPSLRVARRARVLDVRDTGDGASVVEATLAVAVPDDVRVAFAARYGDLTLSIAPADDDRVGEATELPDGIDDRARDLPGGGDDG